MYHRGVVVVPVVWVKVWSEPEQSGAHGSRKNVSFYQIVPNVEMNPTTARRLETAAAAGQDSHLSQDPAFPSLAAGATQCLALAARNGHLTTVQLLLGHKAYTPALQSGGFSLRDAAWRDLARALKEAAKHGHVLVSAALLSVPTRPNRSIAGDMDDAAALDAAAAAGQHDVIQLLCSSIPQQDPRIMSQRPILTPLLAWDAKHAARRGWSIFAWYCRIRLYLLLCYQAASTLSSLALILSHAGVLPASLGEYPSALIFTVSFISVQAVYWFI